MAEIHALPVTHRHKVRSSSVNYCNAGFTSLKSTTIEVADRKVHYVFTPARSLALAAILAGSALLLRAEELPAETIYERSLPSVLTLRVENKAGDRYVGTAFLAVKEGIALLNAIQDVYLAKEITVA